MSDATGLRDTIVPKSDQLNADDMIGGPITVTITGVARGDKDQPVCVRLAGDRQPYKPCKSMRRVLILAWGDDGAVWVGRSMTLYRDASVAFGGVKVGGIRISHLSHIDRPLDLMLTATRGKREPYHVDVLKRPPTLDEVLAAQGVTLADADAFAAEKGKPKPSEGDEAARSKWAQFFAKNPNALKKAPAQESAPNTSTDETP